MIHTKKITYTDGDIMMEGYCAYSDGNPTKKPAILVAHDWSGRNDFACQKAERLAELGYVGFAIDMYGDARTGKDINEKSALMKPLMDDREKLKRRILAAFDTVTKLEFVNTAKIGAIGFCFGGLCVLDLARCDVDVRGVVSFHGLLAAPANNPCKATRTKILVLHGYEDPMAPPEQVAAFENEMATANADWQVHIYSHTKHAFTNPQANNKELGLVYNSLTEKRAWVAMKSFFEEVCGS